MRRVLGLTFVLLILITAVSHAQEEAPYKIVGFYMGWSVYERQYFVTDIPVEQLTHLNYAFAKISEDGEIMVSDEWGDTQMPYPDDAANAELKGNFHQFQLLKTAHPHLQTLISVGGWEWSGNFSDVALTPESRAKFADSVVAFIVQYGFDGVDIDWEYPTGGGLAGNVERVEDRPNFVYLLQDLRAALDRQGEADGRHYLLTIDVGATPEAYNPLEWKQIHPVVDWINLMTYELSGGWSAVTGFHAPLYASSDNAPEANSVDGVVSDLLTLGVPSKKIVVGVPFYGQSWMGVPAEQNGLHQAHDGSANGTWQPGTVDYDDLATNYLGTYARFWDETAQAPWLYSADSGIMISYDDAESLALKAGYVQEHDLGGVMIWELSADDANHTLLTALYENLNLP